MEGNCADKLKCWLKTDIWVKSCCLNFGRDLRLPSLHDLRPQTWLLQNCINIILWWKIGFPVLLESCAFNFPVIEVLPTELLAWGGKSGTARAAFMQIRWHNFGTYFGMKLHFCSLRPPKQHMMCVEFSFLCFDRVLFSKFPISAYLKALPKTVFDGRFDHLCQA